MSVGLAVVMYIRLNALLNPQTEEATQHNLAA
jgi:hypothetical protein